MSCVFENHKGCNPFEKGMLGFERPFKPQHTPFRRAAAGGGLSIIYNFQENSHETSWFSIKSQARHACGV